MRQVSSLSPHMSRKALVLVFLLALGVRVALVFIYRPGWPGSEMIRAARGLAATGTLSNVWGPEPTAHVTPIYPAILAGLYWLFGGGQGEFPALPQQLLAALTAALTITTVPVLARRLGLRPAAGWTAAVCLALLPVHTVETDGRWEQPLAGLALAGLLLLAAGLQESAFQSWKRVMAFGLLMGITGLLAPAILPAAALALAAAWFASRADFGRVLIAGSAIALICVVAWAPWTIRNYLMLGGFVPLRSNFGLEFRLGNNPGADGTGLALKHAHPSDDKEQYKHLQELGELAYMREQQRIALDWISENPGGFAALCGKRFLLFWFPSQVMCAQARPLIGTFIAAIFAGTAALSLAWLILTRHHYRWLLAAGLLGPSLVYLISHVLIRYRYPVFFVSMLVAWEAIFALATRLRPTQKILAATDEDRRLALVAHGGS